VADLTTIIGEGAFDGTVRNQINANFTALNSGSGGSILHQATVTLNNSQILHLPTTAVEIVAAQGSAKAIVPVSCFMRLDTAAGAITADAGASWLLQYAGGTYLSSPQPVSGFLASARIADLFFPVLAYQINADDFGASTVIGSGVLGVSTNSDNKALQIKDDWNGVSDYTDGNVANSLKVSVAYLVLDTTTGIFE
jgi:hypothetical protein